jgi:putative membrane protein
MTTDILIRYFHFLGIFVIFAAVLGQHLLLRGTVTRAIIAKAQRFDIAYAVAVIIVLGTGLLQWFSGSKPAVFYSSNPVFHTKFTLFLVIGLVSIYPSVYMGKQKKGDPTELVTIPKGLVHSIRIELLLLVAMPLLAVIMAKGIGIPVVKP